MTQTDDVKIGRPQYDPSERDRAQVKAMAGMGIPQEGISKVIGISEPTLRRHFRKELDVGQYEANAKVAQSLFMQATNKDKPNVVACIFWLKVRAGWREDESIDGENLGKKEQKVKAAEKVANGKRFSPGRMPKLVINNG